MSKPFINIHTHIFTVKHAPDYFLKTVISNTIFAEWVDQLLQQKSTSKVMSVIKYLQPKKYRSRIERYIEFVQIGTAANQEDIYNQLANTYKKFGDFRIIVLTQVLDYLDLELTSNHIKIQTQVEQVAQIKRNALYQDTIFPFLGLDPRMSGFNLLNDWVKKYIHKDYGFCGIKIYPAAGYFPFDIRFDPIWEWAEKNEIPVMTHCTRGGSFYLGSFASIMNSGGFTIQSLNPGSPSMVSIRNRISALLADNETQKTNSMWCNIFGYPENYLPVLEKYPRLKLCLAHFGGSNEILRAHGNSKGSPVYPKYFQNNWYQDVQSIMKKYSSVYTDISYTLSDKNALYHIANDMRLPSAIDEKGSPLIKRLMFGTDFYLTQQEKKGDEPDLQNLFLQNFTSAEIQLISYENPENFLG